MDFRARTSRRPSAAPPPPSARSTAPTCSSPEGRASSAAGSWRSSRGRGGPRHRPVRHGADPRPRALPPGRPDLAGLDFLTLVGGDAARFAVPDEHFTHVVHAATDTSAEAAGDPMRLVTGIVDGTRRVVEGAAARGARRLLYVSSGRSTGLKPRTSRASRRTNRAPAIPSTRARPTGGEAARRADLHSRARGRRPRPRDRARLRLRRAGTAPRRAFRHRQLHPGRGGGAADRGGGRRDAAPVLPLRG